MRRTIEQREGIGLTAHVVQARSLFSSQITLDLPTLISVQQGTKCLRAAGREVLLRAGDLVALNGAQTCDVVNTPCSASGVYEARWLALDEGLLSQFLHDGPRGSKIQDLLVCRPSSEHLQSAFSHACAAIISSADIPHQAAVSRMKEMLGWIDHLGGYFDIVSAPRAGLKIRRLIQADIAGTWPASRASSALGMSEATLRRRLADEGTHYQQLLTDVRMSHALTLLQVTDLSVTTIAYDVGYASPSGFTHRFRQRFGFSPSDVRVS